MTRKADIAAIALILLSLVRIASTWTVFSATVDEPMHISAGLQLYTQHVYTYQPENPPLPRVVHALAPWLGKMEFDPQRKQDEQLLRVFYSNDRYKTNLVLARAGNLLFFTLAAIAVWLWARRELGSGAGFVATLLFALQPVVAGHAGLATHDVAATAGVAWSLFAFVRWMDVSDLRRAAAFGAAFALAVLCKFSCLGYVPAACLAMFIVRAIRERVAWKSVLPSFFVALTTTLFVLWCGYAFQAGAFLAGIRGLRAIDQSGAHFGFLFGQVSTKGWWWYFPAAVALKSTIASLVLMFAARRRGLEALAAVAAIFFVAMPSHLSLGVRYVLPLYAPLAVAGASAVQAIARSATRPTRAGWAETRPAVWIVVALLAWHSGASVLAHPDSFPYFNEAAGPQPWRYLIDSNLDWGQDALRLKRVLRQKKVERVGLAVFGWHDWDALGFPPHYALQRDVPSQGWVAVSEHIFGLARGAPWLEGRRYERIGTSIRLYYVK
jgi:4-amino-4-deoxy-L-arabinose transferase-like glycosyltransferase